MKNDSAEQLRFLSENLADGMVYQINSGIDGTLRHFSYLSPAVERMHGLTVDEVLADPSRLYAQVMEDDRRLLGEQEASAFATRTRLDMDVRVRLPSGEIRWRRFISAPRVAADGSMLWDGIEIDITERKQAEELRERLQAQLLHSQKMEVIGQLAGGVAHDFNNLLAAMTIQLNLMQLEPDPSPETLREAMDELLTTINRAASLTRQLLLFGRQQPMTRTPLDLNVLLVDIEKMLLRVLGENIQVELQRGPFPLRFLGDAGMIQQVVLNLTINARDAMPAGGRLLIAADATDLDADQAQVKGPQVRPGPYASLRVSDTGCGIDPAILQRIFEPFFTTKDVGKGTGLGLPTAYSILSQHGGWLEVTSEVGKGSTFAAFLPLSEADAEDAPAGSEKQPGGAPASPARILLVEDEGYVRRVTARCLLHLGYPVAEARSAEAALRVWEKESGRFDLLLTDMVMPGGKTGLDLCRTLRTHKPTLRAIIVSGHSVDLLRKEIIATEGITLLTKPFSAQSLAAAIQTTLQHPREPEP